MYVVTGDWTFEAGGLNVCVEFSLFAMKDNRPESDDVEWPETPEVSLI